MVFLYGQCPTTTSSGAMILYGATLNGQGLAQVPFFNYEFPSHTGKPLLVPCGAPKVHGQEEISEYSRSDCGIASNSLETIMRDQTPQLIQKVINAVLFLPTRCQLKHAHISNRFKSREIQTE